MVLPNYLGKFTQESDDKTSAKKLDIKNVFEKGMAKLSQEQVKNQVLQILNYQDNFTIGYGPFITFLANCNMALKKYNQDTNPETRNIFEKSLDDTVRVNQLTRASYKEYLNNLKINDTKSFIVWILSAVGHVFTAVLYKKQDDVRGVHFEAVVVNKGERNSHKMYERYRISEKNIEQITFMLGYSSNSNMTVAEIYNRLKRYAIDHKCEKLGDIIAREQIIGNCYYKELEAGLKYAYSNAYNKFELKTVHKKSYKVPKWPVETVVFHQQIIENIRNVMKVPPLSLEDKLYIDKYIDNNIARYTKSKRIKSILSNGGDIYLTKEEAANTLIRQTMREHNLKVIKLLLDEGVSPNVRDEFGATPLMHETVYGYSKKIVKMLLKKGADVNLQDNLGSTALMNEISYRRNKGIIKMLLKKGADVNLKNEDGSTALMLEIAGVHSKHVIKMLLEKGADVNLQDKHGNTALMLEISNRNKKDIIKMLLEQGADVNLQDKHGWTALILEISGGRSKDITEMLLEKGADVNLQDKYGWTALMIEIAHGSKKDITEMLLEKGTDVNLQDKHGWTALMIEIVHRNRKDVIKMLLEKGADVNLQNNVGWTALMYETEYGHNKEIIKMLLERGANVNLQGNDGKTPLMLEIENGNNKEIVEMLIEKGASVELTNKADSTALISLNNNQDHATIDKPKEKLRNINNLDNQKSSLNKEIQ